MLHAVGYGLALFSLVILITGMKDKVVNQKNYMIGALILCCLFIVGVFLIFS